MYKIFITICAGMWICNALSMQIIGPADVIAMTVTGKVRGSIYIDILTKITNEKNWIHSFYDIEKQQYHSKFDLQLTNASCLACNDQYIMVGTHNGYVRIINRPEFIELKTKERKILEHTYDVKLHNTAIYRMYADKEYLVTGSDARNICMWKIADFELFHQGQQKKPKPIYTLSNAYLLKYIHRNITYADWKIGDMVRYFGRKIAALFPTSSEVIKTLSIAVDGHMHMVNGLMEPGYKKKNLTTIDISAHNLEQYALPFIDYKGDEKGVIFDFILARDLDLEYISKNIDQKSVSQRYEMLLQAPSQQIYVYNKSIADKYIIEVTQQAVYAWNLTQLTQSKELTLKPTKPYSAGSNASIITSTLYQNYLFLLIKEESGYLSVKIINLIKLL